MSSIILPEVPAYYTNPKLDYFVIQNLQVAMQQRLEWIDRAYHLAKVGLDKDGLGYPQIHSNNGTGEHFDIRPDNKISSYCFFEHERSFIIDPNNQEATFFLSVIFWNQLDLIDVARDYDFTSELTKDVTDVLINHFQATEINVETRPERIFDKYSGIKQNLKQFLLRRYSGFKVTFTVKDSLDRCASTEIYNELPSSAQCSIRSLGTIWTDGDGVPSDSIGINGDYYLDNLTGNVYHKEIGVYVLVANIMGPSGGGSGSVAWDDVTDKPTEFPPEAHNHDDRYYTKSESDDLLNEKQDALGFTPENVANKATNLTTNDNTHYPTTGAVKTADDQVLIDAKAYSDGLVTSIFRPVGDFDASGGLFPTSGSGSGGSIRRGDTYNVSVAGTLGGVAYDIGDNFYANTNNPGQTSSNWSRFESNTQQATESSRGTLKVVTQATIEDNTSTNDIDSVTTKKFWQGFAKGLTLASFLSAVRGTALTGLDLTTNAVISASDSILSALGKLQKQITDHKNDTSNPHGVTKSQVGLGNVDNTSDADKPVSTAQQAAIDALKIKVIAASSTDSAITGATGAMKVYSVPIPAGTFATGDIIEVKSRMKRISGNNANVSLTFRHHTLDQISGSTVIGTVTATSAQNEAGLTRTYSVEGTSSTTGFAFATNAPTDETANNAATETFTADWSVNNYFIVGLNLSNGSDNAAMDYILIRRIRS